MNAIKLFRRMRVRKDFIVLMPSGSGGVELISSKDLDNNAVTSMLEQLVAERKST